MSSIARAIEPAVLDLALRVSPLAQIAPSASPDEIDVSSAAYGLVAGVVFGLGLAGIVVGSLAYGRSRRSDHLTRSYMDETKARLVQLEAQAARLRDTVDQQVTNAASAASNPGTDVRKSHMGDGSDEIHIEART